MNQPKTSTVEATKRPWMIQNNWGYQTIRTVNSGVILASNQSSDCSREVSNANAALIVQAVNEYEALCAVAEAANSLCNGESLQDWAILKSAISTLTTLREKQGK